MISQNFFKKTAAILHRLEEGFLCLLLLAMIGLAVVQISLRTFFSGGLLWADPFLRYLVLWSGMFGAALATRKGKHIALDVVNFLVPEQLQPWLKCLLDFFSFLVALVLVYAAVIFVRNEAEFGATLLLSVPSWYWNLVFPLAFALIALRFLTSCVTDLLILLGKKERQKSPLRLVP
ncbi:MAG: TRAP transporter small permease [Proteobacteria bacterium]|nr:TRAP transporter small permease [Pseudomonadota bacterium]